MKMIIPHADFNEEERFNFVMWHANMLALAFADGWFYHLGSEHGYRRSLSLKGGALTLVIPDDFDVGNLARVYDHGESITFSSFYGRIGAFRQIVWDQP